MQGFLTSVSALAKDVSAAATQAAAQAKTQAQKTQEEFRRVVNSASSAEAGETASGEGEDTAQAQGSEVGQAASGGKGLETFNTFFSRAKEVAKDMAVNARATAEEAQGKLSELTASSAALLSANKQGNDLESESQGKKSERERYGVTDEMVAFVKGLTPDMFMAKSQEWPKEDNDSWKLTPWQEKHVLLVLKEANELRDCRYLLTPKKMSEQRFWEIYFALSQRLMFNKPAGVEAPQAKGAEASVAGAAERVEGLALREGGADSEGEGTPSADGEQSEGELSEDLEAYLESVLADKDASDGEGEEENDDDEEDGNLEDYINKLEEDIGSDTSDEIVKVEKDD
mmetsp:Transcript_3820/g.13403  ORF Transcript_3820/g.13403 Transcript_3820/m.13403 type:complete len:343 (+) Transcript_3820:80-1108(+)